MRKIMVSLFLALLTILVLTSRSADAKTQQGKCGSKAKWRYDTKTEAITISGKGNVSKKLRIKANVSEVKKIVVKEGITSIGRLVIYIDGYREYDEYNIQLVLPDSLKRIGWIGSVTEKGTDTQEFNMSYVTLKIPKNVNKIKQGVLSNIHPRNVVVDPQNKSFMSKNGAVFSKDQKTLVYYPPTKKKKIYKIPSRVRKIAPLAFYGNKHLKKVVFPKGLKEIGSGAFCGCTKLSSINLDQTKIKKLTDYKNYTYDNGYEQVDEYLLIDAESDHSVLNRDEYPSVNALHSKEYCGTFEGTSLTSVRLPDSLAYASSDTFRPNYFLTKSKRAPMTLHLGKNFTGDINQDTKGYQGNKSLCLSCMPLAEVTVDPANPKYSVKNKALYSKDGKILYQHFTSDNRKNYFVDAGTKRIAPGAFSWGDSISDLVVEGSLDFIGYCAFSSFHVYPDRTVYGEYKKMLQHVRVKGDIRRIDAMAFRSSSLVTVECGGEIHYIGQRAFEGCSLLTSIPLDKGLKIVGGLAFCRCKKLQFSFSHTLKSIGSQAFFSCEAIKELYIPDSTDRILGGAFGGCKNLETVSMPQTLLELGRMHGWIFDSCGSLKNITFREKGK